MIGGDARARLHRLLATVRERRPALGAYAFALQAAMIGDRWCLEIITPGGEAFPLTAAGARAVQELPVYLYGHTTTLLTATQLDLNHGDLVEELEVVTVYTSMRKDDESGYAHLRSYVTPGNLDNVLLFVMTRRPAGWPP